MDTRPENASSDEISGESGPQYVVIARRYRPQSFDELVGQEHVARALSNAIASNRVGHAYLFTGARGVGKTSAARIFAKSINCAKGMSPHPCNRCDICVRISSGDDVDVLEIDGASNRGIDEIRELRQNVNVLPSRARFKVYMIDEVHMLTREAFNALLKTLEEPPEHVKFVFCTTEPEKVPITILSRCQRFDFAGIETQAIVERLRQIIMAEGVDADPEALVLLARQAGGSMRDSQSLLEQLLAFAPGRITLADVHQLLGTADDSRVRSLVAQVCERQPAAALDEAAACLAAGVDPGRLLEQLLGHFRDMLVAAVGGPNELLLRTPPDEAERLRQLASQTGVATILAMMQIVDQAMARLRFSTQGRTIVEMAIVRIATLEDLESLDSLVERLRQPATASVQTASPGRLQLPSAGPRPPMIERPRAETAPLESTPPAQEPSTTKESGEPPKKKPLEAHDAPSELLAIETDSASSAAPLSNETIAEVWDDVLSKLSDLIAENARYCERPYVAGPNRLVLSFQAKYTSCKSFCERPERTARLEQALASVTGQPVRVEFRLEEDSESPADAPRPKPARSLQERMREKSEHPLVRRVLDVFDGRAVQMNEPPGK